MRLLTICAALYLTACSGITQQIRTNTTKTPQEILVQLQQRGQGLFAAKLEGKVEAFVEGERMKLPMTVMVARPGNIFFEVYEMAAGGALNTLVTNGNTYQVYDRLRNEFYEGAVNRCAMQTLVRVPLKPEDAMRVFLGAAPLLKGPIKLELQGDLLLLGNARGYRQVIRLGFPNYDILQAELYGPTGRQLWHIIHTDFQTVPNKGLNLRLPRLTKIVDTARKIDIEIRWKRDIHEFNPSIKPGAFERIFDQEMPPEVKKLRLPRCEQAALNAG